MTVISSAHTLFGLSTDTKPTDVPIDRLFFETDTLQQFYFNGAVWQQLPGGLSGLNPNSTILEHSTTLSDYTTPTNATSTSSTATPITNPNKADASQDSTFTIPQFDSSVGQQYTAGNFFIGETIATVRLHIFKHQATSGSIDVGVWASDGTTPRSTVNVLVSSLPVSFQSIDYAITPYVIQTGDIIGFKDVDIVGGNGIQLGDNLGTIEANFTGKRGTDFGSNDNANIGMITGISLAGATEAIDGDTGTFWQSDPGINESITLDMGSVVNNFSLAYYIDKVQTDITETQIQIIDDTTGDILRTVNVSDLVDQTYNYIRFNGVNTQFIKIEGSSGNSLVMAANELEVLVESDPPITTLHGQFTINGTDDTLPLNGGDPTTSLIDDPQVNTITYNNVGTPNDPELEKGLMWVETTDAENNSLKLKIKSNNVIKEFDITGGGITGLNPNSTILEYLEDETLYTLPTSAFASSDDGNPPDDAIDDNTGTFWRSNAEVNPEIALNMGSLVNCYGLAYYLASGIGNTETQFEILSGDGGDSPTFVDNFVYPDQPTADAAWPSNDTAVSRVNIANQDMDVNLTASGSNDSIVHDLQDELGAGQFLDTTFIVRFKMTIVGEVQSNQHSCYFGISNMNETADQTVAMNFVGVVLNNQLVVQNYGSRNTNGVILNSGTSGSTNSVAWAPSQVHYWEITQSSGTSTVNRYPDDTYTTPTDSSSQSSAIGSDLRYIKFQNNAAGTGGTFTVTIDDVVVNNGSLTIPTPTFPTNVIRTVDFSDLTEDAWNFIRFNGVNAQTIGIRGSSGNSLVMAANELRVQIEEDPPLTTLHGQFTINGTDPALPLNGGDPTSSVVNDPAVNSLTLNGTVTQGDPPTGASVMWTEPIDGSNDAIFAKLKVSDTIEVVQVTPLTQTPWTSNIDADGFDLQDLSNIEFRNTTGAPAGTIPNIHAASSDMFVNVPTGNSLHITVNAVNQYIFDVNGVDWGTNGLSRMGILSFDDTDTSIDQLADRLTYDVATGGLHRFRVNDVTEYDFDATQADFNGNNLVNVGYFESDDATPASSGAVRLGNGTKATGIGFRNGIDTDDHFLWFDSNNFKIDINNVLEYAFSATALDLMGNKIDNAGDITLDTASTKLRFDGNASGDTYVEGFGTDEINFTIGGQRGFILDEVTGEVNVICGRLAALATTATNGFLYIPSMAGVPTGDSTAKTGKFPIVWDSVGESLYLNTETTTWVEIGGGSQTPWTSDIDGDGFHLQDVGAIEFRDPTAVLPAGSVFYMGVESSGMVFNSPSGNQFNIDVNGTTEFIFDSATLHLFDNTLDFTTGVVRWATGETIGVETNDMIFDVTTGNTFAFDVNSIRKMEIGQNQIEFFGGIALLGAGSYRGGSASPPTTGIFRLSTADTIAWRNAANNNNHTVDWASDVFTLNFATVPEYEFSSTQADFNENNLINIGFLEQNEITEPATPSAGLVRLWPENSEGFSVIKYKGSNGLTNTLSQDVFIPVRNTSGVTILAGEVVYQVGAQGNRITVAKAQANSSSTMPGVGFMLQDLNNNSNGFILVAGIERDINTNAFTEGDPLYVSTSVAGDVQITKPVHPNVPQKMGTVIVKSTTVGEITVFPGDTGGEDEGTNKNSFLVGDGTAGTKTVGFVNTNTGSLSWNPTAARTLTLPDTTDTIVARDTTDTLTNKTLGTATAFSVDFTLNDAVDVILNATTGSKIGTGTTQKLGFWNATPVIQPAHIADPTGGATVDAEARTAINAILAQLAATGMQASS